MKTLNFLKKTKTINAFSPEKASGRLAAFLLSVSASCLLAGLLTGCGTPQPQPASDPGLDRGDDYYDRLNEKNKGERDEALDRARQKYTGPKCETDKDCTKICRSLYRSSVRDDCLSLAIANVEVLEEMHDMFKNPKEKDLDEVDEADFETYVSIDIKPFDKRVNDFSATEAKRVLAWFVENDEVRDHFRDVDDEFDMFEELLKTVAGGNVKNALRRTVTKSYSLVELATKEGDEDILAWLHDFFSEGTTGADKCGDKNDQEVCILQRWYCSLSLSGDQWDEVSGFEAFETIANEILTEYTTTHDGTVKHTEDQRTAAPRGTNKGGITWWENDIEELGDLSSPGDIEDLCPPVKLIQR